VNESDPSVFTKMTRSEVAENAELVPDDHYSLDLVLLFALLFLSLSHTILPCVLTCLVCDRE
jgi:hypothetical protein